MFDWFLPCFWLHFERFVNVRSLLCFWCFPLLMMRGNRDKKREAIWIMGQQTSGIIEMVTFIFIVLIYRF